MSEHVPRYIAWVWFFRWDLQDRQSSRPPTENSHNRCLGWATCGAGRLLALHTSSREQTNIFHWACHAFVKDQHVSGEAFTALFTRSARYACVRKRAQVNLHLCERLCVYICVSVHLIANRHSVDLIILKPPSAIYKETVGQQWNQCKPGLFSHSAST